MWPDVLFVWRVRCSGGDPGNALLELAKGWNTHAMDVELIDGISDGVLKPENGACVNST